MPINELRAIEMFAKAVEFGSLRRAAKAQGVSPQAASQQLAQLEQHLGVRLLHRTTRDIALTDEGRQFLEATQPALAALERATQRVRASKDEVAGPLRIIAPKSSFLPILWPVIDNFCQQHPDVQPDVHLDDRIGNWVQDRADVGFRIGSPPEDGLIARRLFTVQLIVCAAPSYIAAHGAPDSLDELASHRCSMFRHPVTGRVYPWFFKVDKEVVSLDLPPAISTNDTELEAEAVLSGRVIGSLSNLSAAAHIRAGRLVPLLTAHATDHMGVHIYYGSRTSQPVRVRSFIDLAIEQLTDTAVYELSSKELAAAEAKGRRKVMRAK
ncbi:LysR family transcriptional regulator [Acidovorax sp. SUPP2522]|uniref:LysR family transcriptional regulator n=1 Tax=unclassified Acidovorax TaxID=2684926 RepID=UPI00234A89A4|nr:MULTISPECIES: LysR family transcriptional regulator [unclassified Acidovorax]WCM96708.1 LysR family transcriptional regulator [Acidovorax sp. GBBC 1281]GKT19924.1 LysR family transcriptional regulator [Acidovorax sp. SUPP2522]